MDPVQRDARKAVESSHAPGKSGVTMVYVGNHYEDKAHNGQVGIVVGVEQKKPEDRLSPHEIVPKSVGGVETDVIETGPIKALSLPPAKSQTLADRLRPAPGGISVGHIAITAGTLGAWVRRGASERRRILSNNHVLANSNDGRPGDAIIQPGRFDRGSDPADRIALLEDFVHINFPGEGPGGGGGGKKKAGMFLWRFAKAVPNAIAGVVGCPYRLIVAIPQVVTQPNPNLVDVALALALDDADALSSVLNLGDINGIRDLILNDRVRKVGRTTELTSGFVDGIDGSVAVDYEKPQPASFGDQLIIRGNNGSEFSAGGDSGSVILTEDNFIGGLLFAGGGGTTIANRISHVVALMGVRL